MSDRGRSGFKIMDNRSGSHHQSPVWLMTFAQVTKRQSTSSQSLTGLHLRGRSQLTDVKKQSFAAPLDPLDVMLVHRRVTLSSMSPVPIYTTGWNWASNH